VFIGTGNSLLQPPEGEEPLPIGFTFAGNWTGAVYSFGLPGKDEFDDLPETESPPAN
jgi:hypothetical protein